jgi:hypothetical protein
MPHDYVPPRTRERLAWNEVAVWTVAMYAEGTKDGEDWHAVSSDLLVDNGWDRDMAVSEGMVKCLQFFPESSGWSGHRVAVTKHVLEVGGGAAMLAQMGVGVRTGDEAEGERNTQ